MNSAEMEELCWTGLLVPSRGAGHGLLPYVKVSEGLGADPAYCPGPSTALN